MKPLKNNILCGKHVPEDHRYNVEFYIMKASVQCSLPMWLNLDLSGQGETILNDMSNKKIIVIVRFMDHVN